VKKEKRKRGEQGRGEVDGEGGLEEDGEGTSGWRRKISKQQKKRWRTRSGERDGERGKVVEKETANIMTQKEK
jgi:hypothetical protein